jgi:hypothetical protein
MINIHFEFTFNKCFCKLGSITNGKINFSEFHIYTSQLTSLIENDLYNQTGVSQTFTLTLYTNFGVINTVVNSFRI